MRNENFIIHSWQARVAPRKKKQSGYGIFYVSDFEILCSRLDKSRMLTFMNRRIRTRMFGGVGGVVLKPPYPNRSMERFVTLTEVTLALSTTIVMDVTTKVNR
jgi:hypothetical protein